MAEEGYGARQKDPGLEHLTAHHLTTELKEVVGEVTATGPQRQQRATSNRSFPGRGHFGPCLFSIVIVGTPKSAKKKNFKEFISIYLSQKEDMIGSKISIV